MDEREYERMAAAQDRSWWFKGRRRVIRGALDRLPVTAPLRIVDVGCGTGGNLAMLSQLGDVTGVEPSPVAGALASRLTGLPVVEGTAEATSVAADSADVVTLIDVLEHLDDEQAALAEIQRVLRPGGWLLLTVPAFMLLWSGHDEALHHRRRYRAKQLVGVLEAAGFRVAWHTYYNAALFPPVAAVRVARRLLGGDKREADVADAVPGPVATALEELFAVERFVVGRAQLPFGVSLIAAAQAPPAS